ncbi:MULTISPECIES: hypothetical protein [Gammaproteobacteria]|uniref:hypothetical protein n=1 Tax=Gammaproteobacteria TaxID=1236 RepID=UPI000C0C0309|nr:MULTISPECIES: hypothetical protein [Gammaproteobacteria]EAP4202270.1 hypothetical protein [Salmonella enterica subsp. enterica serovar Poona]EDE2003465.1 hypothetical protein [Salmonella enterica]EJH3342505.1 hypothetical protein [Salmonella enterica subsp. enterica serovar Montevideo]MCB3578729.1 hypothetical protein [Klebsiella pneumoniae]EHQ7937260.1 hypothetical protein [Salmonella enterica]
MEKAIQRYLADDRQYQDRVAVAIGLVEEKGAEYEALCQQRAQLGSWQKIITFRQFRRHIAAIRSALKGHNSDLRYLRRGRGQLKDELVSRVVKQAIDGSQFLDRIIHAQERLDAASRLHKSNTRLVDMGQKALNEIREASSSVSSAQTMEVLDLVTDNKGISVMSSMSSSSASSEIDDAKRAVKAFSSALGEHRDIVGSLPHSMSTEFIDLGMDFAGLNDGFDLGSVFSLFSLSSASSSLDKVESCVELLMPTLKRAASNSEAEYARANEEFFGLKRQACIQVYELLLTNDVEVSVKHFESAVDSYRVGN